jgi:hypothetical protein
MRSDANSPAGRDAEIGRRVHSMRRWRLAISIAAVVLGLVLVLTGHVLVGVVIGGLAAARLVMFSRFGGRRWRGTPGMSASDREWFRTQVRDEFLVASQAIGCPAGDLRDQWQQGRSIAEVATQRSADVGEVTAAIAADVTAKALDAERAGAVTHETAQRVEALAPRFAERLVHRHRAARRD